MTREQALAKAFKTVATERDNDLDAQFTAIYAMRDSGRVKVQAKKRLNELTQESRNCGCGVSLGWRMAQWYPHCSKACADKGGK